MFLKIHTPPSHLWHVARYLVDTGTGRVDRPRFVAKNRLRLIRRLAQNFGDSKHQVLQSLLSNRINVACQSMSLQTYEMGC